MKATPKESPVKARPLRSSARRGDPVKKKKKTGKKQTKSNITRQKVEKYVDFLSTIKGLKEKDFKTIIPYLNNDAFNLLSECIHNALCNNCIPSASQKKLREALWEKKKMLRYIAKSSNNIDRKRKLIPQLGGNLGLIISAVLPILMNLLNGRH